MFNSNDAGPAIQAPGGGPPGYHVLRRLNPLYWGQRPAKDDRRLMDIAANRASAADRERQWTGSTASFLTCLYYAIRKAPDAADDRDIFALQRRELAQAAPLGPYAGLVRMLPPVGPLPTEYLYHFATAPFALEGPELVRCDVDGAGRVRSPSPDAVFYDERGSPLPPVVPEPRYPAHSHFYNVATLFARAGKNDATTADAMRVLGPHLPDGAAIEHRTNMCASENTFTGEVHVFCSEFGRRCCTQPRPARRIGVVCTHAPLAVD